MTLGDERTDAPWWGEPWDERDPRGSAPGAPANGGGLPGADGVTDLDLDRDPEDGAAGEGPAGYAVFGSTPVAASGGHEEGWGRHHRRWLLVIAALAGIVLFTGIGAAIGVHIGRNDAKGADVTINKSGKVASAPVVNSNGATTIEAVAAAVQPAVVSISETTSQIRGTGSGVVIDAEHGYIITNNHVVSAVANGGGKVTVTTSDGRTAAADIVGRDPTSDIAVVRVRLDNLTQAQIGDSSTLKVGQTLVAFGSPLGLQGTVTSGIVSALDRPVSTQDTTGTGDNTQATIDAIQTDAAINPGNSGGALVDGAGKLIGINSAIASTSTDSTSESGSIGVGFAIPINEAIKVADQIIATGHAVHPVVGASVSDSTSDVNGALIRDVTAGGPAADAGLRVGDVITQVDRRAVVDADSAIVAIRKDHNPGDQVQITYVRDGATKATMLTLAASAPSP
jgi:putative serine protease PepD